MFKAEVSVLSIPFLVEVGAVIYKNVKRKLKMLCDSEYRGWGKTKALSSVGLQEASAFLSTKGVPRNWKMDISEILESSSSDEEDGTAAETDEEEEKREEKTEEVAVSLSDFTHSSKII